MGNSNSCRIVTAMMVCCLVLSLPVICFPLSFSEPVLVSGSTNGIAYRGAPSVAISADTGVIAVAWVERSSDGIYFIESSISLDNGKSWSEPATILSTEAGSPVELVSTDVTLSAQGMGIYFVYVSKPQASQVRSDLYMLRSLDGGSTFNEIPFVVSSNTGNNVINQSPILRHLGGSSLLCLWEYSHLGEAEDRLVYARSQSDGRYWERQTLIETPGRVNDADLVIDQPSGIIYLAYVHDQMVWVGRSPSLESGFSYSQVRPQGSDVEQLRPAIATDSRGGVNIAWSGLLSDELYNHIFFMRSSDYGQSWHGFKRLNGVQLYDHYQCDMLIDDEDVINVVWNDYQGGFLKPMLKYACSKDYGESFSVEPKKVTPQRALCAQLDPLLFEQEDYLGLVWIERANEQQPSGEIYYAHSIPDTPTPTPTITATPTATPTPAAPKIAAAGYMNTRITTQQGGIMFILGYGVGQQGKSVVSMEICYKGIPIGLSLDDLGGGVFAIPNLYINRGYPAQRFLLELMATDDAGLQSKLWPYLWALE